MANRAILPPCWIEDQNQIASRHRFGPQRFSFFFREKLKKQPGCSARGSFTSLLNPCLFRKSESFLRRLVDYTAQNGIQTFIDKIGSLAALSLLEPERLFGNMTPQSDLLKKVETLSIQLPHKLSASFPTRSLMFRLPIWIFLFARRILKLKARFKGTQPSELEGKHDKVFNQPGCLKPVQSAISEPEHTRTTPVGVSIWQWIPQSRSPYISITFCREFLNATATWTMAGSGTFTGPSSAFCRRCIRLISLRRLSEVVHSTAPSNLNQQKTSTPNQHTANKNASAWVLISARW